MASPFLHGWLDAIQRGQLHGGPQLGPDIPVPSLEEVLDVQATYATMTGERLPLDWLTQTLKAAPAALIPATPVPSPALTGWRAWWSRLQQALQGVPKAPAPLGLVEWQLVRMQWRRRTRTLGGNAVAVVLAALFLNYLGHGQGTWHAISTVVSGVGLTLALGAAFSAVVGWMYAPVRRIRKVKDALWARSPLAQGYLHARAKTSPLPLLIRDEQHLDRLCRVDGLYRRDRSVDAFLPPAAPRTSA